jgi:hypothetical protein
MMSNDCWVSFCVLFLHFIKNCGSYELLLGNVAYGSETQYIGQCNLTESLESLQQNVNVRYSEPQRSPFHLIKGAQA